MTSVLNPRGALSRIWGTMRERLNSEWFETMQQHGLHTKLVHYYSPIPDTRTLARDLWQRRSTLPGVDMRLDAQLALLQDFQIRFRAEYERLAGRPTSEPHQYKLENSFFTAVDAEILWCMIRSYKPRRIIEIGSGNSTFLSAEAVLQNARDGSPAGELIAIEPFPSDTLRRGFPGLTCLIEDRVQGVPLGTFESLAANDILFIDSSHVVKIGSDVIYEILEILPRLKPGVLVHVHDVFFPEEYPREWVMKRHDFWSEQYLLQAFLSFNLAFEVLWAGHYMAVCHAERVRAAFRSWPRPGTFSPTSFWMRRVG